jgi:Cof subfamily protein (haloacid dehalogenase superfamily)
MTAAFPRVIATDLDGTLVRTDGAISARTVAALNAVEDAGALVIFVTGRPPRWLAPVAAATGHRGLAICTNGAQVYDLGTEEVVEEYLLGPTVAAEVVRILQEALPAATYAVERRSGFAYTPEYRPRWEIPSDSLRAAIELLVAEPAAKLLVRHDDLDADALLVATRDVVGHLAELTHSSLDGLVEISASGVSKATTLEILCAERGIGAANVLAFGDMPNDLPLLAWAGRGVAVANAHPSVLAAVTEHTDSNDDDGVAVVLERLLAG